MMLALMMISCKTGRELDEANHQLNIQDVTIMDLRQQIMDLQVSNFALSQTNEKLRGECRNMATDYNACKQRLDVAEKRIKELASGSR
jgi:predicted  nucleic acid-binding Zn-ribbon protein